MEVATFEISGFKLFEPSARISAPQFHSFFNDSSIDQSKKYFLLDALLGVIFGFTSQQKQQFRGNPDLIKTFTGFLTLKSGDRTLMIERDFETDFVACLLSDTKNTRPIFQGKDFVDNGYSRPYLQMLKSIFPMISDQEMMMQAMHQILRTDSDAILDAIDLFFTPQFKFNSARYTINEAESLIAAYPAHQNEESYERYELLRKGVILALNIKKQIISLENDVVRINRLMSTISPDKMDSERFEEKFHSIKDFEPLKLRKEVIMWKSLRQMKSQHEEELRALRFKKNRLNNIIDSDLYEYKKLPDTFTKEARRYKEIDLHLTGLNSHLKKYKDEIREIEDSIDDSGKIKKFVLFSVPVLIFLIAYIVFGPVWTLIIPGTLLVFLSLLAVAGHATYKNRSKIFRIQEEIDFLMKKIHKQEEEKKQLLRTFPILRDSKYIDTHIERFRKFRQYQNELQTIQQKEQAILETLNAEPYSNQLPALEEKYKNRIDIQRPDLEEYLDEFVALAMPGQNQKAEPPENPIVRELENLETKLQENIQDLIAIQEKVINTFHLDNGYSDLNRALKELDEKLNELRFTKWTDLPL